MARQQIFSADTMIVDEGGHSTPELYKFLKQLYDEVLQGGNGDVMRSELAAVAFSGQYSSLLGLPTLPTGIIRWVIARESQAQRNAGIYWILYNDGWIEQGIRDSASTSNTVRSYTLPNPMANNLYSAIAVGYWPTQNAARAVTVIGTSTSTTLVINRNTFTDNIATGVGVMYWVKGYAAASIMQQYPGYQNFAYDVSMPIGNQ